MLNVNQPKHGLLVQAKQPTLTASTGPLTKQIKKFNA
jgi:hypothetical protein